MTFEEWVERSFWPYRPTFLPAWVLRRIIECELHQALSIRLFSFVATFQMSAVDRWFNIVKGDVVFKWRDDENS